MPRIPDVLLNSVVYVFRDEAGAAAGRGPGGTGFLVDDGQDLFVVSNIHVVGNGCRSLRINTDGDLADVFEIPEGDWTFHPDGDDVAVATMPDDSPTRWAVDAIRLEDFAPTPERMAELNVGVGDDVVMLGRFSSHTGRQRNQPLARFGNIAMMPGEPVRDGRGMLVEAYLVEMRSIPGFSGSPVFLYLGPANYRGNDKMLPFYSETIGLLGIDTGHKPISHPVLDGSTREPVAPRQTVDQNSGIAIIAPTSKIQETLVAT